MTAKYNLVKFFSVIAILAMTFSNVQPQHVEAQSGDGLKRQVNAESGRVSFITPADGKALSAARTLGQSIRPQDPAMALAAKYAPEFGLKDPQRSLTAMDSNRGEDGRITARFQQNYENVPVMGGELIINTNDNGDLYSISGEVSPRLSLTTQPTIVSDQARDTALQAVAKWYEKTPEDFVSTEPELWIYDESLLQPSTRPAELTWRMEVTPKDSDMPVRMLVLVNAQRGTISLHFNQVDTAWQSGRKSDTIPTPTTEPVQPAETPVPPVQPPSLEESQPLMDPVLPGSLNAQIELSGATWYVASNGNDSNFCSSTNSPCATINAAIIKASDGDMIKVGLGTYKGSSTTPVANITKSIALSGGWDPTFTSQDGLSTIDGQNTRVGVYVNSPIVTTVLDHFVVQNCLGGGVYNSGVLTISNSSINNNSASSGGSGGGIINTQQLTLNNTTVRDNKASYYGGGIYNNSITDLTLNNTTISGNSAGYGGGIFNMANSVILNNTTITNNTASVAGGIANYYDGTVSLMNTILAGNTASSGPECVGTIGSLGYNLIGDNDACTYSSSTGDQVGTLYSPISPRLGMLEDNGGGIFTYGLFPGSPAIDAGNPAAPGGGGSACLGTDARGVTRPDGVKCDIGAYEGILPWSPAFRLKTYTDGHRSSLPGTFLCDEMDPYCNLGDPHAKSAHQYAMGTYGFYLNKFSRDSIDNQGMVITSSVHYCEYQGIGHNVCPYYNAFWNGEQVVYGDGYGYPMADDVVAHELTHGVTQYESNLFYYYQSGAINESFSDLWGEYYDQTNGKGNDTVGAKWIIGEDVTGYPLPSGFGLPAMRSMSNPPALQDPDRMSSTYYYKGDEDNGGVHWNSGVNNKAVYLMVEGGSFNAKTVTALGWEKTAAIYYEVNSNLLTSGADYSDLYYALQQACTSLVGQKGIIPSDCIEVKDAIDAVEMDAQPATNFNTEAPQCSWNTPVIAYSDDMETGTGKWIFENTGTANAWQLDSPYGPFAQSGAHFLYADDYPQTGGKPTDAKAKLASFVVPNHAYLWFAQAYDFETGYESNDPTLYYYDGGVLEYSTNNGTTWVDAGSLMEYNKYNGKIYNKLVNSSYINPLHGRSAFVGASHGYISTRLNLASLAGKTVTFRWRMALDGGVSAWGWWLDNIKVYTCGEPTTFADVSRTDPYYNDIEILYANGLTGGCSTGPLKFCPDQIMNRGQAAVFILRANFGASYAAPVPTHVFKDDWSKGTWAEPWAEGMRNEGLSAGCQASPPKYCPWDQIPREQAVIFGLRMKYGTLYTPPPATGTVFADMTNPGYYATSWAEQAYVDGIIPDCGIDGVSGKPKFCPKALVSRGLAAYMIVKAKSLTMP